MKVLTYEQREAARLGTVLPRRARLAAQRVHPEPVTEAQFKKALAAVKARLANNTGRYKP